MQQQQNQTQVPDDLLNLYKMNSFNDLLFGNSAPTVNKPASNFFSSKLDDFHPKNFSCFLLHLPKLPFSRPSCKHIQLLINFKLCHSNVASSKQEKNSFRCCCCCCCIVTLAEPTQCSFNKTKPFEQLVTYYLTKTCTYKMCKHIFEYKKNEKKNF